MKITWKFVKIDDFIQLLWLHNEPKEINHVLYDSPNLFRL